MKPRTLLLLLLLSTGCVREQPPREEEGTVHVEDAWVRPGRADGMSALYFTLINDRGRPDTLAAVMVPVAGRAEMHETRTEGGMSGMYPLERVPIPPHSQVHFMPGGKHVMLFQLRRTLMPGDSVDVQLILTRDTLHVRAPVREGG